MSELPGGFLGKHKRTVLLAIAVSVLAMYVLPFDELAAAVGGKSGEKKDSAADKDDKPSDKKVKDNNCENGLPPHKNGNSDNGNHYGCLKHL